MSSKKVIFVGIRFSNFFRLLETTEFLFFLGLFRTLVWAWTYVFLFTTQENTRQLQSQRPQKKLFLSASGSRIFFQYSKRSNFCIFPRAFPDVRISVNLCILVYCTRKLLKFASQRSSKNVLCVGTSFSNFFRLIETTEFLFFLGLFQTLVTA